MGKKERILIADALSPVLIQEIKESGREHSYVFEGALNSQECWEKIYAFLPDVVVVDLLLTERHGIHILKKIREDPNLKKIKVVISSAYPMIQNYRIALEQNADYFLSKPFSLEMFFQLLRHLLEEKTLDLKFQRKVVTSQAVKIPTPQLLPLGGGHVDHSFLKFYGTRGSSPVSGSSFIKYGGNTSCLEVRDGEDFIIIDAGSGIFPLGHTLSKSSCKNVNLLISHLHWDHVIGLLSFAPLYRSETKLTIWSPEGFQKTIRELLDRIFDYSFFPIRFDDISARLELKEIYPGKPVNIGSIQVDAFPLYHPCSTLCFKLSVRNKTIIYVSDNEIFMGFQGHPRDLVETDRVLQPYQGVINFLRDCDILIHEAQYFAEEYASKIGWGHSSVNAAVGLVKFSQPREWIVTHHDPSHTDAQLDEKLSLHRLLLQECHIPCHIDFAYDGLILPI
jgi:ribonuclease BN (tRNA processing enzyme)/CheY-like chemotaxis protein